MVATNLCFNAQVVPLTSVSTHEYFPLTLTFIVWIIITQVILIFHIKRKVVPVSNKY